MTSQFVGRRRGRYSAIVAGHGFVAAVEGVTTTRGVHDAVAGHGDTITFEGGLPRPLTVALAQGPRRAGATVWSATVQTHTLAGHREGATLSPAGTLRIAHGGGDGTVSFTLSSTHDGTFMSGPLHVASADRLTVAPVRDMRAARLTIRDRRGRTRTLSVRNHAEPLARLSLARPQLVGKRVVVGMRIRGLRTRSVLGIVLSIVGHGRVLNRIATHLAHARNGSRTFRFLVPPSVHGRVRLQANAELVSVAQGSAGTSASATTRTMRSLR